MRLLLAFAAAGLTVLAGPARAGAQAEGAAADSVPAVPLEVEAVVSGGRWAAGSASGGYRLLVITEGWEAIRRRAVLEWIQQAEAPDDSDTIRARVDLTQAAGMYSLTQPQIVSRGAKWYVTACAADRPYQQATVPVTLEIGAPGRVRRVPASSPRGGDLTRRCG